MSEVGQIRAKRPKTGGRGPGVPNKATQEFRVTVRQLLEKNAANVGRWLDAVAKDDPDKALRHVAALAEYAAPKLQRTELTGEGGGALKVVINKLA